MKKSLMAGGSSFAHLAHGAAAAAAAASDDEDDKKDDKKAVKAATDGGEEDENEDEDKKKGKKARKKAEKPDDEDEKAELEENDPENTEKAAISGAHRERARGDAIFACEAAGLRPDVAAFIAFRTDLPAATAVKLLNCVVEGEPKALRAVPGVSVAEVVTLKPAKLDLKTRMAREPDHDVGEDVAEPKKGDTLAAQILLAGRKRRGEAA